jgi:hypothetical protein
MSDTVPLPAAAEQPKVDSASPSPSASAPEPEVRHESTPSAEGSEERADAEPGKDEGKPKRSASGRISELYAQKRNAEADAIAARQEAQRLRADLENIQRARHDPNLPYEDQETLRLRQAVKAERQEQVAAEAVYKAQVAAHRRAEAFNERVDAVRDRFPDFDRVVDEGLPISEYSADLIAESEYGPQIAYHLGKNRSEAARIAGLPPHLQGAAIARIEAQVSVPVRKVSQAPPPPPRVSGGSSPGAKDPAEMSASEYSEWYRKRSAG